MGSREGSHHGAVDQFSKTYDVFINHRGPDVKNTFVAHLYDALARDGLRPFLDAEDIGLVCKVSDSIDAALRSARVHVAIFSSRYAESARCLNELCDMLETGKPILPVFYHVKPESLRRIESGQFHEGFRKHEGRPEMQEKIPKWKQALDEVASIKGLVVDENRNEAEMLRKIVAAVRHLMRSTDRIDYGLQRLQQITNSRGDVLHRLDGHPHGEGENHPHNLGPVESRMVFPLKTQAPEVTQNNQTSFRSGDRRLNILLLGDPRSVEALIRRICGIESPGNLQECISSSPPMCLIGDTRETYSKNFARLKDFVKARNEKWQCPQVEIMWDEEVQRPGPANRQASLSSSLTGSSLSSSSMTGSKKVGSKESRLHMVVFVCKELSDLPNKFEWRKITEKLYGLPVHILVQGPRAASIREHGSEFFPNAPNPEDLIVDVEDLPDLRERVWRVCWDAKTRSEISHAADVIRTIRKHLGPNGKSFPLGAGSCGVTTKEVSLRRSGEFFINFLSTFWDVPSEAIRHVLTSKTSFKQGNKISIKPGEFVKFCLIVAALFLFDAHDSTGQPKHACDSNVDSLSLFLETEAYRSLPSFDYCDRMATEDIRQFLQSVLDRTPYRVASVNKTNLSWQRLTRALRLNRHRDKGDFELLKAKDQGTLVENSISFKDGNIDVLKDDIMGNDEFISSVKKRMEAITSIQIVDIEEAFTIDHSFDQTTIVLGLYNAASDNLEFYCESGESMAKLIGVGLHHAKVVVKHGIIFEVQEIEREKWEKIWCEVKECSTKVFKIMKVRLPQASGFIPSGGLVEGRDVASSLALVNEVFQDHTPIASNYVHQVPFLWEISKFFIMERVIDTFHTKCSNDMWNENIEAQCMENYPSEGSETEMTWFQTLKVLFSKGTSNHNDNNQRQGEMDQGERKGNLGGNGGNGDFPRGYSNINNVKEKEIFTQVNVILLSGGEFFEKSMEPLSNRHPISIERLDNVKVTPELIFGFHKTRDNKKIQITTSVVFALDLDCDSIESCPHSINHEHESCGHFGWFHDELYESLGPIDQHIQRTAYLRHDFKEGDYVSGKTTSKASTSKDITRGNEKGYQTSLAIGSSQVARLAFGASMKQQASCMDHESSEQSIESQCNLTQGGFKIQAKHMMHLALLQYKCLAPYIEIIADQVKNRKYRYDLINHPMCNLQKTQFSGTWLPIGDHEVATYVFKANRQLHEIQIEEETLTNGSSGFKALFRKRNNKSLEVHLHSSLEPPITQAYEKQLYVNHSMSHLVDGHTYTLIESSEPQNPFGDVDAPLVRFPILVNYQ